MAAGSLPRVEAPAEAVASPGIIKAAACLAGVSIERSVPVEEIHNYIRELDNLLWVDVQDPGPQELSLLLEEFAIHPLALEDVARGANRPKADEYKGYLFVVTCSVVSGADTRDVQLTEVDLLIGGNYLVTVHRGAVPALDEAYDRWTRGGQMLTEGVGFLVYTVVDALIDAYFPLIDAIEVHMDAAELEMFTGAGRVGVHDLLRLKRTLVTLRRVLVPLRDVFSVFLRRERPMFSPGTHVYFQDVHDHVLRILDVLDTEREMVTGALEANLTVLSNRLNATMKTLTVITIVVAFVGAVFGAWGMNFTHIPLSESVWGFWVVCAGTLLAVALALGLARKRGWL
jgi:magnesium transporter